MSIMEYKLDEVITVNAVSSTAIRSKYPCMSVLCRYVPHAPVTEAPAELLHSEQYSVHSALMLGKDKLIEWKLPQQKHMPVCLADWYPPKFLDHQMSQQYVQGVLNQNILQVKTEANRRVRIELPQFKWDYSENDALDQMMQQQAQAAKLHQQALLVEVIQQSLRLCNRIGQQYRGEPVDWNEVDVQLPTPQGVTEAEGGTVVGRPTTMLPATAGLPQATLNKDGSLSEEYLRKVEADLLKYATRELQPVSPEQTPELQGLQELQEILELQAISRGEQLQE